MEGSMQLALRLATLALLLCSAAQAQEVQTGSMMICDTRSQVERFVTLLASAGDPASAAKAVNTEAADPTACARADIAYLRGARLGVVRTPSDAFEIVEILVIGVPTAAGIRPIKPARGFTLVKLKEYAV
jgi:hypothetical protein